MRRITTTLVLITLLTLVGFGFVAMGHSGGTHTSAGGNYLGCIASNAQGSVCPDGSNPLLYALFHLNALQTFLLGVVPPSATASTLLLLISLLLVSFSLFVPFSDSRITAALLWQKGSAQTTSVTFHERLTEWLALREKCDPALSF